MENYGFGFLPDNLVDWGDFKIHEDLTSGLDIPGFKISTGKRAYDEIEDSPGALFAMLRELLEAEWKHKGRVKMICRLSSYLILREYRKYALKRICYAFGALRKGAA
ncbi:uncharacterized protein CTRU02_201007 [Colletotrichum truncatum]|uniref:Uncharacterized protein n=1 Tax=Colletotrichum truncatum TaxID=5467 RepID=A0ACC3ZG71_COLTU|nr:uncharacterized protein CTRU02_00777 [Colletotrichum truncatum]KAF6802028.1 hypothetical protein CTRU02_00777 [Colletotrichum truncatum]